MKIRFTPGDWRIGFTDNQSIVSDYKNKVIKVGSTTFCDRKNISLNESIANAKLMAAGPQLIIALMNIIPKAKLAGIDITEANEAIAKALDF